MTNEATTQYLDRIRDDCASVLGRDIPVLSVEHEDLGAAVRLVVRYDVHGGVHETSASGETIVAAHAALRTQLVQVRLGIGFRTLMRGT